MQFDAILKGHTQLRTLCPPFPTNAVLPGPQCTTKAGARTVRFQPELFRLFTLRGIRDYLEWQMRKGAVRISASLVIGIAMAVRSILYPT
jgi:hypothetical protein